MDKLYILDSNWNVDNASDYEVIKTDPNVRYYDVYKEVLPQIGADIVLFMDNDMVVYREGVVAKTFELIASEQTRVVSIYDTIGEYKTDRLGGKNKFCPYWFATRKGLLMQYRNIEWGSHMPHSETLGLLTEAMLNNGEDPYEYEEDKSNCLFDGIQDGEKSKDLGYYHIRAGSTPSYLLATRKYGDRETYEKYIHGQPRNEYLRQLAWYWIMGGREFINKKLLEEMNVFYSDWLIYVEKFRKYYGLR